jgi:REP element-mobilizing transposase RayT
VTDQVADMARKLRLEFPGACYHVINRGNYRFDIFRSDATKSAFEALLFETCEKSHWLLHAFTLMRNHYHLAIETPEGNLVDGMKWLQTTFANRFNLRRQERGHVFQARYKALLVEEGDPLGSVCHYIHLNPVRAGVLPVTRLAEFRYSSYWYLGRPQARPKFLRPETALVAAGGLVDSPAGRERYAAYLDWQAQEGPAGKSAAYVNLSRGWALGSAAFRTALVQDHALVARSRAWETLGAKEIKEIQWTQALAEMLKLAHLEPAQLFQQPKSAPAKLAVAAFMKRCTQASNPWLCRHLHLGHPRALSHNLTHYHRHLRATDKLWLTLTSQYSA